MNPVIFADMKEMHDAGIVDWHRLYGKTVLISGAYGMLASYMVFMLIYLNETQPGANIRFSLWVATRISSPSVLVTTPAGTT